MGSEDSVRNTCGTTRPRINYARHLWKIHTCAPHNPETSPGNDSNALLQCRHAESLDNFRSWLGFDHHHFAEDLPLTRFRRRLHASLNHDQARDGELAGLLHILEGH